MSSTNSKEIKLILLDIKTYYKVIRAETKCYLSKNRQTEEWKRIKNSEIDQYVFKMGYFIQLASYIHGKKVDYLVDESWKIASYNKVYIKYLNVKVKL